MNSALAAVIGLVLAILLIVRKVSPFYSLMLGALTGGMLSGIGLEATVGISIKERIKLIPYESLVGVVLTSLSIASAAVL